MWTIKEYYNNGYLAKLKARIVSINWNKIELDKTIAFPEWWWQEWDKWIITLIKNEVKINFIDTQKSLWRMIFLDDFPTINVDTTVKHIISDENKDLLKLAKVWDEVIIEIDILRREKLSTSHTASHLLYIWVLKTRPEAIEKIKWCHISEENARFDFHIEEKFSEEDICRIVKTVNNLIIKDLEIKTYQHQKESEALFWECDNIIIPCWWTHLEKTWNILESFIKRKNIWKWKERLIINFPNAKFDLNKYFIK